MDFYQILELQPQATEDDIRRSFRRLAKQYHPDTSTDPEADDKFKLVYMAYDILQDPFKRGLYDELRQQGISGVEMDPAERRRYERYRRRAAYQAQQYANMEYEEFEETFMSRLKFHGSHALGFIVFFLFLCLGMGLLLVGIKYIFYEKFNGSSLLGYALGAISAGFITISLKALLGVFEAWRQN